MTKRRQARIINELIRLNMLVSINYYVRIGTLVQVFTGTRTRFVPLTIAECMARTRRKEIEHGVAIAGRFS